LIKWPTFETDAVELLSHLEDAFDRCERVRTHIASTIETASPDFATVEQTQTGAEINLDGIFKARVAGSVRSVVRTLWNPFNRLERRTGRLSASLSNGNSQQGPSSNDTPDTEAEDSSSISTEGDVSSWLNDRNTSELGEDDTYISKLAAKQSMQFELKTSSSAETSRCWLLRSRDSAGTLRCRGCVDVCGFLDCRL
jgi:hypothetical protein